MNIAKDAEPARTVERPVGDARSQIQIRCRYPASRLGGEGRLPLDLITACGAVAVVASCEVEVGSRWETKDLLAIVSAASSEVAISPGQTTDPSF